VLQFDLRVDDGVPAGTLISNQAVVASYELPNVLTDGDGNPATGPEPTLVVVGPAQQLAITKQVAVVGGGPAIAGATLEYVVRVLNISTLPATDVRIYDDLDLPVAGQLVFVDGSATMNGVPAGITFDDPLLTADYYAVYGDLAPGAEILLRFQAMIYPDLPTGTTVTNTAEVRWNDPQQIATASVSIDVGGVVGVGMLNGSIWHDANFDDDPDLDERLLEGWTVAVYRDDVLIRSTLTDADGAYRIPGLAPTYMRESLYELRFSAPGAGPSTAPLGLAISDFTNSLQRISEIVVSSGSNLQNLSLPIDPNGVVYDSVARTPIGGARLTLQNASSGSPVAATCFDDEAQQDQVTLADGYYKFDLNFSDPSCPSGADYTIAVAVPSAAYVAGYSEIIPPTSGAGTAPFSVPDCLLGGAADAIPATSLFCEIQNSEFAPAVSVRARSAGTEYHVLLTLDASTGPGSRQLFNNHLPIDLDLADSVAISKETPLFTVTRGQLVPYLITVTNDIGFDLTDISIVDRFPPGFKYVAGSARIDGTALEPELIGLELVWSDLGITGAGSHELQLLLAVGSGVSEGEFVNRAQVVHSLTGNAMSGEGSATVRLVPDPDFDCTDVFGKVYDDTNRNGRQDAGEAGLPGIRLVTARGLAATTDEYGRYHITCAIVPNETRGSNFVLKLDDRTLPTGFRASTAPVRIERATRGKALQISFGASIHRVIGLDLADPVFEPDSVAMRPQWIPRISILIDELQKAPATLRLSYLADIEEPGLVQRRLDAVQSEIEERWKGLDCCYDLEVEPEIFWRRGAPPERRAGKVPAREGAR
jgi:large repetitive protein